MIPEDLKALADRASTIEGRPGDRLLEVRDRIRRESRRRQLVAVTASAIAVVLALTAGTALVALRGHDRNPPANPPRPTDTPSVKNEPSIRRLVWWVGDKIHFGERTIDAPGDVGRAEATDDGVAFVSAGRPRNGNTIWFSNGSAIERIGRTNGSIVRGYGIETSTVGSILVWWEPAGALDVNGTPVPPSRGAYVVYDTDQRRVLTRLATVPDPRVGTLSGAPGLVMGVYDDYVYWIPGKSWCAKFDNYNRVCRRYKGIMRYDVTTGLKERVSWAAYEADRRSRPRTLLVGDSLRTAVVADPDFRRYGHRLVPGVPGEPAPEVTSAFDARTGRKVHLRVVPTDYETFGDFRPVQWLDDDRLAMFVDGGDVAPGGGDLFVCRLSTGTCRLEVARSRTGYEAH